MSLSLTPVQAKCLGFVSRRLADTGGIAPTYEEIGEALALASKSGVKRLLDGLEERGRIRRLPHRQRAIEVVGEREAVDVAALGEAELRALGARVAAELQRRLEGTPS